MRPQPDDSYYLAESQLLSVIDSTATGDRTPLDARRVVAALDADRGRWLLFSVDRLHQFGFRFDTY